MYLNITWFLLYENPRVWTKSKIDDGQYKAGRWTFLKWDTVYSHTTLNKPTNLTKWDTDAEMGAQMKKELQCAMNMHQFPTRNVIESLHTTKKILIKNENKINSGVHKFSTQKNI